MNNNPPAKPGANGGSTTTNVTYSGATTISESITKSGESYTSSQANQNAVLVSGGTVSLTNFTLTKTGSTSGGDSADFYGTNAGILTYNDANLTISGARISTEAEHANAVFAYGNSSITISDSTIETKSNTSGGIMVTGGGKLTATNLTVTTAGNSSAPIRSDRGGGTMTVTGGTYTANGVGSPAIYSTADITVNNATLNSTASEGVVIEGKNSVKLNGVTLTDTNNQLNGQSETYKNIFIYQSMSGDASEGTGNFEAKDSAITTNKGDSFFITNTTATIKLENCSFTNNDTTGVFLRAQAGKWGTSGSNGGKVTLSASHQDIFGNIIVDKVSSISMSLTNSYYEGAITGEGKKSLILSEDSFFVLTGDTVLDSLSNPVSDNSNIYANGFTLTVAGAKVAVNEGTAPEDAKKGSSEEKTDEKPAETSTTEDTSQTNDGPSWVPFVVIGAASAALIAAAVITVITVRKKKRAKTTPPSTPSAPIAPQM